MGYLSAAIERPNCNDLLRHCTRKVNATRSTSDWPYTSCLGETKEGIKKHGLLTNRDCEVVENSRSRVKIKTKLTNFKIKSRIEGSSGE